MWFRRIPGRLRNQPELPLFDEAFLHRMEQLSFRTAPWLRGARWGERRSHQLRPTFDFSDHRPYSAGDDLRHVDWNVYGRHGELFVKLGETTQSVNVHVFLDTSRSMAWSPGRDSDTVRSLLSVKWNAARRLAGALGYLGLTGGDRLLITPFSRALHPGFGPTQGKHHVVKALQFLSELALARSPNRYAPNGGLVQGLATFARAHPQGGLLVLISDLYDFVEPQLHSGPSAEIGVSEILTRGLRPFVPPRWQVLVVHLLAGQEVRPTFEGDLDLQDIETGARLPFRMNEGTLAQYRGRVEKWCAELQSVCTQWGVAYSRVLAEWPLEQAVVPYLQRRGVIQ